MVLWQIKLDEFKEELVAILRKGSRKVFVADRDRTCLVNLYNWLKKTNLDVSPETTCA
jgi:hypothetical protein